MRWVGRRVWRRPGCAVTFNRMPVSMHLGGQLVITRSTKVCCAWQAQCLCSYAQGQSRIADRIDQLALVSRESARARSSSVGWV